MLGELELVIEWGRAGTLLRSRVERFSDERALNRRFWALLERRRRHGYVPAVEGFRSVPLEPSAGPAE
jgi:predicted DNA-binding WGR domain protein